MTGEQAIVFILAALKAGFYNEKSPRGLASFDRELRHPLPDAEIGTVHSPKYIRFSFYQDLFHSLFMTDQIARNGGNRVDVMDNPEGTPWREIYDGLSTEVMNQIKGEDAQSQQKYKNYAKASYNVMFFKALDDAIRRSKDTFKRLTPFSQEYETRNPGAEEKFMKDVRKILGSEIEAFLSIFRSLINKDEIEMMSVVGAKRQEDWSRKGPDIDLSGRDS